MPFRLLAIPFGPARATRAQRRVLLRLVATAVENRLPLAELVDAWAEEERGRQRIRLRRLAEALRNDTSLPNALERQPTLLSEEELLMVQCASESGTLAPTLRHYLDRSENTANLTGGNLERLVGYGLLFVLIGLPVAVFIQTVLTSQLISIYEEFGLEVPRVLRVSRFLVSWAPFAWLLWLATLLAAVWWRLFDWPLGYIRRVIAPKLSRSLRSRQIANVLRNLGMSASSGRPISGALATLARYHYDPALRHQLLYVRNELGLGADLWPTLSGSGVLTAKEYAALVASDRAGVRGWTLQALAAARERKAHARVAWQTAVLLPVVVLAFGVFVGVQSLGIFSFLTNLITSLA